MAAHPEIPSWIGLRSALDTNMFLSEITQRMYCAECRTDFGICLGMACEL